MNPPDRFTSSTTRRDRGRPFVTAVLLGTGAFVLAAGVWREA